MGSMYDGRLIVEGAGNWASTVWLRDQESFSIGRSSECDIRLHDNKCSKLHAVIVLQDGQYILTDKGSSNGTYVNGAPVQSQRLRTGDEIRLGDSLISFIDTSESSASIPSFTGVVPRVDAGEDNLSKAIADFSDSVNGMRNDLKETPYVVSQLSELQARLEAMQENVKQLNTKSNLMAVMAGPGPFSSRMQEALRVVAEGCGAENAFVMLIDPDTHKWVVRCRCGDIADWQKKTGRPLSLSIVKETVSKADTVFSNAMGEDMRFAGNMSVVALDIKSAISAPILDATRKVKGVVYVDRRRTTGTFSDVDKGRVELLASVFASVAMVE